MPNELTLIRSARSAGNGVGTTGTVNLYLSKATSRDVSVYSISHLYRYFLCQKKLTLGVWLAELDVGWNGLVFQRQDGLDNTGDSRRAFRVAEVGFHRAYVDPSSTKDLPYCMCLNWIAGRRPRAVALNC